MISAGLCVKLWIPMCWLSAEREKVLGVGKLDSIETITELLDENVGGFIDSMLNERLLGILSTKENVNLQTVLNIWTSKNFRQS